MSVAIILFLVMAYLYWKMAVYAAPLLIAFAFGQLATTLGGSWLMIGIAALIGFFVTYFILGVLEEMKLGWVSKILIFAPSFYIGFGLTHLFMANEFKRGQFESIFAALFVGLICAVTAVKRYEALAVSNEVSQ